MSETGCCLVPAPPATAALTMAHWIRTALETMGATVWCFWQPDWGVIDLDGGVPRTLPQFRRHRAVSRALSVPATASCPPPTRTCSPPAAPTSDTSWWW